MLQPSYVAYFALGLVMYSFIEHWRDWRFVSAEAGGQAAFVALSLWGLSRLPAGLVRGAAMGAAFWLFAVLVRFLVRRHPIEAAPLSPTSKYQVVPVGLIDFCWVGIMGGTLAFVAFSASSPPFSDPLPPRGLPESYYLSLGENSRFLLGHTIDGFFALGAVLTACMAILWAGEIWRGDRQEHRRNYKATTVAAAKMVFAFFWISLGIFVWIACPLYERLMAASAALR